MCDDDNRGDVALDVRVEKGVGPCADVVGGLAAWGGFISPRSPTGDSKRISSVVSPS